MADEVPAYELLNEAMEYLSKLGANLRTRSENFKHKRVQKNKLKNSHAIQKAANKVLLICELSKKSLQNVADGVQKVLSNVESAQRPSTSSMGKVSESPKSKEKEFHYFKYQMKKLRIANKISLKHFLSVKVHALKMPKSLQDKYPVYHNCKLYRMRKRKERINSGDSLKSEPIKDNIEMAKDMADQNNMDLNDTKCIPSSTNERDLVSNVEKKHIDDDLSKNSMRCKRKRNQSNEDSEHSASDNSIKNKCVKKEKRINVINVSSNDDATQEVEENGSPENGTVANIKYFNDSGDNNTHPAKKVKLSSSDSSNSKKNSAKRRNSAICKKEKRKSIISDGSDEDAMQEVKQNVTSENDDKSGQSETRLQTDSVQNSEKGRNSAICTKEKRKSIISDSSDDDAMHEVKQNETAENVTSENNDKAGRSETPLQTDSVLDSDDVSKRKTEKRRKSAIYVKKKKTNVINDSSDDDHASQEVKETETAGNVTSENDNKSGYSETRLQTDSVLDSDRRKSAIYDKKKKTNIINDSSNDDDASQEVKETTIAENATSDSNSGENKNQSTIRIKLFPQSLTEDKDVNSNPMEDDHQGDEVQSKKSEPKSDNKPSIKCVSLSRLLKPDVLNKISDKLSKPKRKPEKDQKKILEKCNKSKKSVQIETESEEEYWNRKSEEVKSFISRNFIISVEKLPKLTIDFLHQHNLRRIVHSNSVICEIMEESVLDKQHNVQECTNDLQKSKNSYDIDKVKNSLLCDSDSDSNNRLNSEQQKIKDVLLDESDSDNNTIDTSASNLKTSEKNVQLQMQQKEDNCEIAKKSKRKKKSLKENSPDDSSSRSHENANPICDQESHAENSHQQEVSGCTDINNITNENNTIDETQNNTETCNNSKKENSHKDKDSNEAVVKSDEDKTNLQADKNELDSRNNEIKSALLNSSDDQSKTPEKKKKRDSTTPCSKRKHIMESMHAKKMLLTYSSSSETEDEQLRGALKEIKVALLKGISSDDEKHGDEEDKQHSHKKRKEKRAQKEKHRRKLLSSDSDDENTEARAEPSKTKSLEDKEQKSENEETENVATDTVDTQSNSSKSKMGGAKTNSASRSSSPSSDSQDSRDKDIDGLTNLKSLTKIRRRRGSPSKTSKASRSRRRGNMSKSPLISTENMLQSESSSEAASAAESDGGEDLPPVSLTNINGSGIGHLAKDDLLGDSDSSSSKGNETEELKKDDSDDNVKSKRRKGVVISSDSEAGSSRKKAVGVKMSDFEDSEAESSEPNKSKKRRKKATDSDASNSNSSNDGKKKRRRIKSVNDSDVSGSDTENEGRKHGRKNIRKVMGKDQLEEATKKAAREEKERIARIAERQKVYNNLEFDESGKPDEVVLEKVVLDFDPETKEPLIQVDRGLVKKLKPHQANGIKFMWDACFESVKRIKKDRGSGCILAHCMGLGKTLQVVSLTHTLLTHSSLTNVNRVLVVCPLSTVLNWVNEFKMWLKHAVTDYDVDVYELSRFKQNSERAFQLQQWFSGGGVCVLGYEMFRNLSADNVKKFKKKLLRHFQESLVDPGPDLVVCDEGHLLKNEKTSLSQSMNRVKTRRRIVLTGTPLQNNLKEYYCMVQFVKPNLLGKYNEYLNRFVNPITNGQYTDSTEHDIRVMKRRSHVLHKMLDGAVQRRDYGVLAPFLPPKHEYVLFITLTDVQVKLYQFYLDNYSRRPLAGKSSGFLFPDFQSLQRIWTHPLVLKYNSERYEIMQQKKREREEEDSEGSLADFIDDDSTPDETSTEESSDDVSDMSDDSRKKSKKKKAGKKGKGKESKASTRRGTRANPVEQLEEALPDPEILEVKNENPTEWWIKLVEEDELDDMKNSHKLVLLFDILRQCETIGDKLLVFSQSLYSLDLIEHFLGKVDEATQEGRIDEKLGGHVGSWSPGVDYFRLDGSTSCENRSIWCKNFNREDNPRARLFLISTRAGGLGINLVAANRVVIFDVSWNPSHDVQSIFRVYRFGQKKPCYIYRFLAMGTMEEKIYERQVTKQAISKRVIDEQQIDRHYAENDLAELYKFEATPPAPRPLPPLPKDRLFAEMLREHDKQIYKYHEHDSLLENKEEETLSEEERKAAWEDFENEKNRPPPAPFPSPWPMANGMVPGLLQQQQLAYAALTQMLRKDMPNINDNQIRDMLPLIYNANPGLMQKMNEIYKYAQPGMMNPGLMNPVMNAASGGGMSGSSGLQYEPPWQRQHQQQQQMRLQQLMQQQNQMGAKYYAGGLGSRDPVAMALQQQRAREIMVGERGRPRGRPPLQPRHAPVPPPPQDVVNLDSD